MIADFEPSSLKCTGNLGS